MIDFILNLPLEMQFAFTVYTSCGLCCAAIYFREFGRLNLLRWVGRFAGLAVVFSLVAYASDATDVAEQSEIALEEMNDAEPATEITDGSGRFVEAISVTVSDGRPLRIVTERGRWAASLPVENRQDRGKRSATASTAGLVRRGSGGETGCGRGDGKFGAADSDEEPGDGGRRGVAHPMPGEPLGLAAWLTGKDL